MTVTTTAEAKTYVTQHEPLWAVAQDPDAPLALTVDTNRPQRGALEETMRNRRPSSLANADHWVRLSLGHIILTGVFARYPRLRVGSAEHELSWAPHFILTRRRRHYSFSSATALPVKIPAR